MKRVLIFIGVFIGIFPLMGSAKPITINVGGYYFPPFVEQQKNQEYIGITLDLIERMNKFQTTFQFDFVATSPKRRFSAFEQHEFDLIMFESLTWGWEGKSLLASDILLHGGEVYITKASHDKNQRYFDDFKGKSLAVVLGYHYGFNNFDADEKHLKERFNIHFNTDQRKNIQQIISGRSDISVVNLSYLHNYLQQNPSARQQLMISEKYDQKYQHTFLLRHDAEISIKQINTLIADMRNEGILDEIWKKYGLESKDALTME